MSNVPLRIVGVLVFGIMLTCSSATARAQDVRINEVMASNRTTIADEDGDYEDWIELFNAGGTAIDLAGYGLSDDAARPFRWIFPEVVLPPGGFLLVWASGKDRRIPSESLHASFGIRADGEDVLLTRPDGVRVDHLPPTPIPGDLSLGRQPDGVGEWFFFQNPTPGAANTTEGFLDLLEPPTFSHVGGLYDDEFALSLTGADESVVIHYTLDGSEPNERAPLYSAPITIRHRTSDPNTISMIPTNRNVRPDEQWRPPVGDVAKGTVVRARASRAGSVPSPVSTHSYLVGLDTRYALPVVSLSTDPANFFDDATGIYVYGDGGNYWQRGDDWERPLHIEFFESEGTPGFSLDAGVRIHGGTSRSRPIKSLRIYARGEYGTNNITYRLFPESDTGEFRRFLLRNSGNDWDRSYFRDALMQSLVTHTRLDIQRYRPVVVFLNGEYWGIHNLRDRLDRHHLSIRYGLDPDDIAIMENDSVLKEGDEEDARHYRELIEFVRGGVESAERFAVVETMMDIDNFIDFQIANIYFRNTDWPGNNVEVWRKRMPAGRPDSPYGHDGRWRWLLFDTDFGFDLDFDYVPGRLDRFRHNTLRFATEAGGEHWPNPDWSTLLLRKLVENDEFRIRFINRFADHLNTSFAPSRVRDIIDEMTSTLSPHMAEHIDRWGGPASVSFWNTEVDRMREFAERRPSYQRQHIASFFGLPGTAVVRVDVAPEGGGRVRVNSIDIDPPTPAIEKTGSWEGVYFVGIPVQIIALPEEGYAFEGWSGTGYEGASDTLVVTLDGDLAVTAHFAAGTSSEIPEAREYHQTSLSIYPNPVVDAATITFTLRDAARVTYRISDVLGRIVLRDQLGHHDAGRHVIHWRASGLSPGLYFLQITTDYGASASSKVILTR